MTNFTETLRHYCRNPRCRSKLPSPVSNPREAFCARGCFNSFYLHRCLVCEGPLQRKREDQKVCRKAKCRNTWRLGSGFGCYAGSSNANSASETPDFIDLKAPPKPDRPWRFVAGPELSASALHCATVSGDQAIQVINRTNARHWREYNVKAEEWSLITRHDPPVNLTGGYNFPSAPVITTPAPIIRLSRPVKETAPSVPIPDDFSIPEFLRRPPRSHDAAPVIPLREAA
jgi:hypothetical protein